jgi:DNA-binding transcriptional LysR family regulator
MVVSDMDILVSVAAGGLGIALAPAYRCVDELRAKRIERVLREWEAPAVPIHLVYPSTRLSPTVKSFIDHLEAHMTPPPWELGPLP